MNNLKGQTFVFLGKSGSGKDTQAEFLQKYADEAGLKTFEISTGDLGRKLAKESTLMGQMTKGVLERGDFFPNWLQVGLWFEVLKDVLTEDLTLFFSGSPRLPVEAEQLDDVMNDVGRSVPAPIYLDISDEESMRRLLERGRPDDTREVIEERLANFKRNVLPIIDRYGERVVRVDGSGAKEDVFERLKTSLKI